jgi:hypothetical protein
MHPRVGFAAMAAISAKRAAARGVSENSAQTFVKLDL